MAFTEFEKARIRHHLGYPSFASVAQSIQLGYPAVSQPLFLVNDAFIRVTLEGEDAARKDLCQCEDIEAQLSSARTRFKATQLGELVVNRDEPFQLRQELRYWREMLASDLGVVINPNAPSTYYGAMNAGGVNATVQG